LSEYQGWTLDDVGNLTYYQIRSLLTEISRRRYNETVLKFQVMRYAMNASGEQTTEFLAALNPENGVKPKDTIESAAMVLPSELPDMEYRGAE